MAKLRPLPYPYDALGPAIDARTVKVHHDKHQAGYVKGYNKTLKRIEASQRHRVETSGPKLIPEMLKARYQNLTFNAAGIVLHEMYWENLTSPGQGGEPTGRLLSQIEQDFGTSPVFLHEMIDVGSAIHGSGWVVLAWVPRFERLTILAVGQHQNGWIPGAVPLLVIDVWEHAYYLQYESSRLDYLKAIWGVMNWHAVNERFAHASSARSGG